MIDRDTEKINQLTEERKRSSPNHATREKNYAGLSGMEAKFTIAA